MKILHTSDWHLGQMLFNNDRGEELAAMIDQMEEILKEEPPDALIVSGDVFHISQPSAGIQTFFTESKEQCGQRTVRPWRSGIQSLSVTSEEGKMQPQ